MRPVCALVPSTPSVWVCLCGGAMYTVWVCLCGGAMYTICLSMLVRWCHVHRLCEYACAVVPCTPTSLSLFVHWCHVHHLSEYARAVVPCTRTSLSLVVQWCHIHQPLWACLCSGAMYTNLLPHLMLIVFVVII